jgi:hypothetical protein
VSDEHSIPRSSGFIKRPQPGAKPEPAKTAQPTSTPPAAAAASTPKHEEQQSGSQGPSVDQTKTFQPKPIEPQFMPSLDDLSAEVRKVFHPAAGVEKYGLNPVNRSIRYYNEDVLDWLGRFSTKNVHRGGIAMQPSSLVEIILQTMIYDVGLQPSGFKSGEEIRQHILSKLK